jgi:putative membrane protein
MRLSTAIAALLLAMTCGGAVAATATPADRAFVAKVSVGGMFEVEAGELAEGRASAQDVKDFAVMEVHDHTLVGAKLKAIATAEGVVLPMRLNADFQGQLDQLRTLRGPAFDAQYMSDMAMLHPMDGAAFATEATDGGSDAFRAFGAETHLIVERHIGAIEAAPPPVK